MSVSVELYVYDLTNGLAALLSPSILGHQVEGVWHTSVVVFGREYFYGGSGVTSCAPGGTQLGAPLRVDQLGRTEVPRDVFQDYLQALSATTYTAQAYRLLEHNCNHFSDEVAQFLCGARLPKHMTQQAERDLPPPLRHALAALLQRALPPAPTPAAAGARDPSPEYDTLNRQVEEARVAGAELGARRHTLAEKLARKERRKQKKVRHRAADAHPHLPGDEEADMSEAVETRAGPSQDLADDAPEQPDQRTLQEQRRRLQDPPRTYPDVDGAAEFARLSECLSGGGGLPADDQQSLEELRQYLVAGEGSWVLGDDFLAFVGRVLAGGEEAARVAALRCLCACALREDVSLLLHQDRRTHALLSHAQQVDARPLPEQRAIALFMCNLFENISSSEWLLYISEWQTEAGATLSNIRVTTKVCVHALLSEDPELRELGTALLYNIATKEVKTVVFDEVCVELVMAALQLLSLAPSEEHLYRCVRAVARLAQHAPDVPQLVAMVGPDPAAFRGTSARVDEQIDLILQKIK